MFGYTKYNFGHEFSFPKIYYITQTCQLEKSLFYKFKNRNSDNKENIIINVKYKTFF